MKKFILILLLFLLTGCSDEVLEVTNPNGKSLTYQYFNEKNYDTTVYNLKLKNGDSTITISKQENDVYYKVIGGMDLIILEKDGMRYKIDTNNKMYSSETIIKKENYTYGILPTDMNTLKNQSYKTGKEKINSHKYIFETYKYDKGKTTYYFDKDKLKFIRKKTDTENLLYKVLSFNALVKENNFKIPKGYIEMTY